MKLNKVIIIAEVGVNHNGRIENAKKIIKNSAKAGADFVKFQELLIKKTPLAKYQKKNSSSNNQFSLLKKYEIDEKFIKKIKTFCNFLNIKMLVTPFDISSFKILVKNKFKFIKISSTDLNNHQLLKYISNFNLKIFISTGMSSNNEIKQAIKILNRNLKKKIILMHCISSYPAEKKTLNFF